MSIRIKYFISLITFLFLSPVISGTNNPEVKHVILIGIDGVTSEGFQVSPMPNLSELIKNGAVSLSTRGVMPTVSAPNWSSILLGAGPEQHGITSNSWSLENHTISPAFADEDGYFPSIFSVIRQQMPGAKTGAFFDWDMIGQLFNKKYVDVVSYVIGAEAVTENAIPFLKNEKPEFAFIYYGEPDEVGHSDGYDTEKYFESITKIDGEIGKIMNAVKTAGIYEETVFIIVTDHGGIGYGHGGESMTELEIPLVISGPGTAKNKLLQSPNNLFNTAPTIAYLLGLNQPDAWIGRPMMEAFDIKTERSYLPKPKSSVESGLYLTDQLLMLSSILPDADIRFTVDGQQPSLQSEKYINPIELSKSQTVKSAVFQNGEMSRVDLINFIRIKNLKSLTLPRDPDPRYNSQGNLSLVDGVRGSDHYNDKRWLGFEENDLEAVFDFGFERPIQSIIIGCLKDENSWIFLPTSIEILVSDDGEKFNSLAVASGESIKQSLTDGVANVMIGFPAVQTKYLKVIITNTGKCPAGHKGEGGKAWLFVDEMIIN